MLPLTDAHAHYYHRRFETECEGGSDALLNRLFGSGEVLRIVNSGTNPVTSRLCVEKAKQYPGMYATVGVHPEDCQEFSDPEEPLFEIRQMLARRTEDKIVAVGEIGLDYHMEGADREKQAYYFDAQMEMAREFSLPVVIHDRDAHGDCFETVLRHPGVIGVFHSYAGSAEMARELWKRGWYFSFSGVVTFKNAARVKEVAASIPVDRLLVETDCPYLAPHPHRGEMNHSGLARLTAATLAELHGMTTDEMIRVTNENAARLFGF